MIFYEIMKSSPVEIQLYDRNDVLSNTVNSITSDAMLFAQGLYVGSFKCSRTGVDFMCFDKGIDRFKGIEYNHVLIVPSIFVKIVHRELKSCLEFRDLSNFADDQV